MVKIIKCYKLLQINYIHFNNLHLHHVYLEDLILIVLWVLHYLKCNNIIQLIKDNNNGHKIQNI